MACTLADIGICPALMSSNQHDLTLALKQLLEIAPTRLSSCLRACRNQPLKASVMGCQANTGLCDHTKAEHPPKQEELFAAAASALFLIWSICGLVWPFPRRQRRSPCLYGVMGTPGTKYSSVRVFCMELT